MLSLKILENSGGFFINGKQRKFAFDSKFEKVIRDIFYYITKYGIDKSGFKKSDISNESKIKEFFEFCHEGWSFAQDNILKNLISLEKHLKNYKNLLKKARRDRDKIHIDEYRDEIGLINTRIEIFRKLADTIAWQMINDEKYIARRLFQEKKPMNLLESNIDSVVKIVRKMNLDKSSFSLISDLTTFVQLGDILKINTAKDVSGLTFFEYKDGVVNEKIFETISSIEKTKCLKILDFAQKEYGPYFIDQFERILKQIRKAKNLENILNKGFGEDYHTGLEVRIPKNRLQLQFYNNYINKGIQQVAEKGYFYGNVDYCLFIGIYGKKCNFPDPDLIFRLACSADISDFLNTDIKENPGRKEDILLYSVYDIRNSFSIPLSIPLFRKDFPFDFIMDLIMGRAFIFLYFDFDIFFKILKELKINARWSTHKEFENIDSKIKKYLIKKNSRVICLEFDEKIGYIGYSTLMRILFDGMTPLSSLAFFLTKPDYDN